MDLIANPAQPAANIFHLRAYYLHTGIAGAICWIFLGSAFIVGSLVFADDSVGHPEILAIVIGLFCSGWMSVCVWLIIAYFREYLILGKTAIIQRGVVRPSTLAISDVTQIRWRAWPVGGTVFVKTRNDRVKIYLDNFTEEERRAIVDYFHNTFPPEMHENWHGFEALHGSPRRPPPNPRLGLIAIATSLMCMAGFFLFVWYCDAGTLYLIVAIVNGVAGIWYLWRLRNLKPPGEAPNAP